MPRSYNSRTGRWRTTRVIPRVVVYTNEGTLNYSAEPILWMREGRKRGAFLSNHMISDDELELRLAATNRE